MDLKTIGSPLSRTASPWSIESTPRARQGVRPCYIHVGTHKTGTTSIQAFLRDNEEQFATHGVLIPRAGRGEDGAGHHNLTQELLNAPGFLVERGSLKDIADELRCSDKPRACISSEDFTLVSRSPQSLASVRDAITAAGFKPLIVVYLRPQVSYCVSIYAEIAKNGNRKPFAAFLSELLEHGTFVWDGSLGPTCRYDALLDRFAAVFGKDAIIVRRYRGSAAKNALLRSFARLITDKALSLDSFKFPPERFNPTLSFQRVLRSLGSEVAVVDMRFSPLNLQNMLQLALFFYRANIRVARRYGTWIPPCEFRDFLLALPLRKTVARTTSLHRARLALRDFPSGSAEF